LNKQSGIAGRRHRRLPALLVAVVALTSAAGVAPARAAGAAVKQSQTLVTLLRAHEARTGPGATAAPLDLVPATTPITGEPTTLPVVARRGRWLKVMLPGRPNGHEGWILDTATLRSVTGWHLVVSTSRRQVTVYLAGKRIRVLEAVVGKPSTPTPIGDFFIEESIALRSSDVGAPFALALSARSNVLQEFDGGPGQIALHGLANVGGVPGTAVSHGCIRLDGGAMRWLVARLGPGVPVTVVR
jgi:lipoprotein-anchoring transpeptidase ErfK/SrfK